MLDILKERLIEGLSIKSVKEYGSKYSICFEYDGDEAKVELPKLCSPTCENYVADRAIITAISTIYFNREDYKNAKEWLDKIGQ